MFITNLNEKYIFLYEKILVCLCFIFKELLPPYSYNVSSFR
ncbi:hypothetical protein BTJ45_03270 [Bacillus mycoides]|nr:hypothetical protein BTJ45_03270 [Bacillus mycoides]